MLYIYRYINRLKNEEALAQLIISLKEENKKNPNSPKCYSPERKQFVLAVCTAWPSCNSPESPGHHHEYIQSVVSQSKTPPYVHIFGD